MILPNETPEALEDSKTVIDKMLNDIQYSADSYAGYVPSSFALEFITFIKLVNGGEGEEHESPVMHYKMLDQIPGKKENIANMCSRGLAKSALFGEYFILYLAVYGKIEGFGTVPYALYVSDSMDNGVKKMRNRIERRRENSEFLMEYLPEAKITENRWYFKNKAGNEFVTTGHGAKTGVRGTVELNSRPVIAILDDLISDQDAKSDTVIASVEDTVYKAVDFALHPTRNKIIWSGTPFNARDPLYKAIESGAWYTNLFPVCEKFPCTREEFRGAWPDRFAYDYVLSKYTKAVKLGKIDTFNQELMLRIMSEEDRLIKDSEIVWYNRNNVLQNKHLYNFYITTDFATEGEEANDYSVISVWAYNSNGDWLWVDGICEKQLMDQNLNDLFRLVQIYRPQDVGIETSGQQGGFIPWIRERMIAKNTFFNIAAEPGSNKPGFRPAPGKGKMVRFQTVLPWFKSHKIWWPENLKDTPEMRECMNELTLASIKGFKGKHDDFVDTISQLGLLQPWKPAADAPKESGDDRTDLWDDDDDEAGVGGLNSYIV